MTAAPSPLTPPEDLIRLITEAQAFIKTTQSFIDDYKAQLSQHLEAGNIPDKLSTTFGSATLTTRTTYAYSPRIKEAQDLEILEGIATKKTSSSWTIKPAKDA
jgi:hypothetical protein